MTNIQKILTRANIYGRVSMQLIENRTQIAPGSFTKSFLGSDYRPRGISNNNPGNILLTQIDWKGKIPNAENSDKKFEQFEAYVYGVRAMIVLLKNYMQKQGLKTVTDIVNKWSPGNLNYVRYVATRLNVQDNAPLSANKDTIKALVTAIANFENGIGSNEKPAIAEGDFEAAWSDVDFNVIGALLFRLTLIKK
jgi:hypothetical protein